VGTPFETTNASGCPTHLRTPQIWFNTCAFTFPAPGVIPNTFQFGTEGRNILTGPGYANLDFGLAKSMALRSESRRLEFRGDFFNLFNHPNFDIPAHVLGATNFGQILSANSYGNKPPRQIQLSARYMF
jgi:hypothetical protein